jgi:uncharacterized protein
MLTMKIVLANVGVSPKPVREEFAPESIDLDGEAVMDGPAEIDAQYYDQDGKVRLAGKILADVTVECTRCLEPQEKSLEIDFAAIFVDADKEQTDEEREVEPEALDESLVIGGEVDTAEVVREQILLALPEQVLCKDDCLGLCPICGENKNLIVCSCGRDEIDPRWAALKELN